MPPERLARTQFAWEGETACTALGFDSARRILASMRVVLGGEVQHDIARTHGGAWRLRVEETLLLHLPRILDLRYGSPR